MVAKNLHTVSNILSAIATLDSTNLHTTLFLKYLSLFFKSYDTMAEDKKQEPLIEIGGKQFPISSINKPHYAVIGGTEKAIPNLENFPPLEPLAAEEKSKEAGSSEGK